jgi:hypothetical protein
MGKVTGFIEYECNITGNLPERWMKMIWLIRVPVVWIVVYHFVIHRLDVLYLI